MSASIFLIVLAGMVTVVVGGCTAGSGGGGTLVNTNDCSDANGPALGFFISGGIGLIGIGSATSGTISGSGMGDLGSGAISGLVSLDGHGFTTICTCSSESTCSVSSTTDTNCAVGAYSIAKFGGGFVCVQFGSEIVGKEVTVGSATTFAEITGDLLTVSIDGGAPVTYDAGSAATSEGGTKLHALVLRKSNTHGVFFSECGPFLVESSSATRKRAPEVGFGSVGAGSRVAAVAASGDPHLAGAHGINFDVFGAPGANYSLLAAPAFEINMQLANRGPEMRFMTAMAVLYKGKSFTITPWTVKAGSAELIAHFAALGANVSINVQDWAITIELCAHHTIVFHTRHTTDKLAINFLNFEVRVPGCHNAYGGLLGQTYQCKYAKEKFKWSREREESFRVPTLDAPSGSYSPLADCAHEGEYRGEAIRGGSFSNSTLSMTTML